MTETELQTQNQYTKTDKHMVLAAACLAIFINPMVGSMLNLALPSIGTDLNCSTHQLGWLTSIYLVASVVGMIPAAQISDIYGKKHIFVIGVFIAILGLILSAVSRDLYMLYMCRAVTGIGMAMVSCNCVSMISDVYTRHERGAALSVNTASVYLGASLGPSLGGAITDVLGWRMIFIIIIPMLLASLVCILRFPCNIAAAPGKPFDGKGSAVYAVGIGLSLTGILALPEIYGAAMIAAGLMILVAFIFMELSDDNPVIEMRMFRNTCFSRSLIALWLNYSASFSISFFLALYLQSIGAMTPTESGMVLMIQPVIQVAVTLFVGRIVDRLDYRILPTAGMGILCLGLVMMSFLGEELNLPYLMVCLAVCGLGFGLFSSPNTTATMSYVTPPEYSKASGLIAMMRQFGMALSMGLATCLVAIFMGSTSSLTSENYGVFVDTMRTAWYICIAMSVVATTLSWFRGKPGTQAE